jgi:hypothetical protein
VREVVLATVRDSIRCDPVLSRRVHRSELLSLAPEEHGTVGLVDASRILGRGFDTTKRLLAGREFAGDGSSGRSVPMAIRRSAVEEIARQHEATLTLEEVAAALAVSKSRARRVAESGLVRVLQQPAGGGRARWAIDGDSVRQLVGRLEANVKPTTGRDVPFNHAAEALRRVGVDLPGMLRMLLDGRLAPAAVDGAERGLRHLRFDAREVRQVCRGLDGSPFLTVQVAAERLGLKWEVVEHLVRHGVLKASEGGVAADEVARFTADYVSGAELARKLGTSPRALARRLEAQGVVPVSGPGVDGGRQNFYRRNGCVHAY